MLPVLAISPWILYPLIFIVAGVCLWWAYKLNQQYQAKRQKRKRHIKRSDDKWLKKQQEHLDRQRRGG